MSLLLLLKPVYPEIRGGEQVPIAPARAKKKRRKIIRTIRRLIPAIREKDDQLERLIAEMEQKIDAIERETKTKRRQEEELILAGLI